MKIALLADIHGNDSALAAVLAQAKAEGASRIVVAGDLVGYYYGAAVVLDLLRPHDPVVCRGNHEDLFEQWRKGDAERREALRRKYGSGFQTADASLSDAQKAYLSALRHPVSKTCDGVRFLISHGAPWDMNARLYPDADAAAMAKLDAYGHDFDVIITAHTHYPVSLQRGAFQIINPGSVGQPRQREKHASVRANWALYDTKTRYVQPMTTYYDATALLEVIEKTDPDVPFLRDVLLRSS